MRTDNDDCGTFSRSLARVKLLRLAISKKARTCLSVTFTFASHRAEV
ncbi:MAG TPA: hypothetical protein VGU72_13750 [Beijerinckiaceae bacterium]|nr:hypothetical protein [Beijerinckiaceae bacterium]